MPNTNHQELWGDIFEITVKRGIIHYLLYSKLLSSTHISIQPWVTYTIHDLRHHLNTQLAATDENYLNLAHHYLNHLLVLGYGLGWTCIREVIQKFNTELSRNQLQLTALWCPLNLRDRIAEQTELEIDATETLHTFWQALHLNGQPDANWLKKGAPARADFFLLLEIAPPKPKRFLLCLEFSLNVPPRLEDFSESEAHLHELENYMYRMERRGVFTRLNSEISDDVTAFSSDIASYISAFTSSDKPFFKLCQASSYLTLLADELHRINSPMPLEVQALAITAAGIEGLSARFDTTFDPRVKLLETFGKTYRKYNATNFNDLESLHKQLILVLSYILRALPKPLQQELKDFLHNPPLGEELRQVITETIKDFHNPDTSVALNELPKWIDSNEVAISQILHHLPKQNPKLRDLHAAAVCTGLNAAKSGQINILALEGYPGIGKTTAVKDWLHRQTTGFLFFYFSPRIVINSNVTTELGMWKPTLGLPLQLSNILTLTSDSLFIKRATTYFIKKAKSQAQINSRYISSAVAFAGIEETTFLRPQKDILFLNTSQIQALDQDGEYTGLHYNLPVSNDRSFIIQDNNTGVWRTLAMAARQALEVNTSLNRVAITAAIQGYRKFNNSTTTVDSLSYLFQHLHHKPLGKSERQRLAERLPTIVVMIDEITGDSAGVLATKQLCLWLEQEFISPFDNNSPFRVIVIIADASLSNAQILQRHVESVNGHAESITSVVPDKILISPSYGIQPLRLIAKSLRLGLRRSWPTLHIEAFGFPAAMPLTLRYDLRFLLLIRPPTSLNKLSLTPRRIISDATKVAMQDQARQLIIQSLQETTGQIIFFAQDREFLEIIASELKEWARNNAHFSDIENKIITLHSKVTQAKRDQLIQPQIRDSMRVILMTSSGSRGVSFPKATHIIALIPRFNIETNLMELAQLIYRGRGYYSDPNQPEVNISGDHAQRTLIFLINDFVISDVDTEPQVKLNQWVRQALDFLTFVILLRATILTRISGNAGLPQQQLAMVPVGNISSSEISVLLADSVRSMMAELKVLLADSNCTNKDSLKSVLQRIENLFRNAVYIQNELSISTNGIAEKLSFNLINNAQALVNVSAPQVIPDNMYSVGPVWLECMQHVNTNEQYEFELFYPKQREEFQNLHSQLHALNLDSTLPKDLRQQAKSLYTILNKIINDYDAVKYVAIKSDQPRQIWNCFPANYPYFMSTLHSNNKILDHEGWWDTLNRSVRSVCSVSSMFPALPVYKSKPFLVIITSGDPTDLQRALDDRYFCASSAVNLLNALLFA